MGHFYPRQEPYQWDFRKEQGLLGSLDGEEALWRQGQANRNILFTAGQSIKPGRRQVAAGKLPKIRGRLPPSAGKLPLAFFKNQGKMIASENVVNTNKQ